MTAPALLRVEVPAGVPADVVSDALWQHGPASVLEGDGWLEAGFASEDAAARVAASLPWPSTVEPVEDASWQDAWRAHAEPVRIGRILVVPTWLDVEGDGDIVVEIDPGTAFGSGSHPSTQLCLGAVVDLAAGRTVLDVGCGSGVLSVVAGRVGAASVTAIDIASEAVAATAENARRNDVDVHARHATVEDIDSPFDLVVANIGAAVLRSIAVELAPLVGEWLVLAGLLDDQVPDVVAAYAARGLELRSVVSLDGWAAPRLARP